jgi:hypothetical protein
VTWCDNLVKFRKICLLTCTWLSSILAMSLWCSFASLPHILVGVSNNHTVPLLKNVDCYKNCYIWQHVTSVAILSKLCSQEIFGKICFLYLKFLRIFYIHYILITEEQLSQPKMATLHRRKQNWQFWGWHRPSSSCIMSTSLRNKTLLWIFWWE